MGNLVEKVGKVVRSSRNLLQEAKQIESTDGEQLEYVVPEAQYLQLMQDVDELMTFEAQREACPYEKLARRFERDRYVPYRCDSVDMEDGHDCCSGE